MKEILLDNYQLKIGQNISENDFLLRSMSKNYTWFHIKNYPSAHLWINENYNKLSKRQIYLCAIELKKSGKFKKRNNIEIMYSLGHNLTLTKLPGTVITNKYKTINV